MPQVALPGVSLTVLNGGLGRRAPSDDNVAAIIFRNYTGPTSPTTFGTAPRRGFRIEDFEALGITEAWQLSSTQLTHYHIEEYFRLNPNGELWVMFVPSGDTRTVAQQIQELQTVSEGRIRTVGYANSYAATTLIGDLATALLTQENRGTPLHAYVEQNTGATVTEANSRISKVVGQDQGYLRILTSTPTGSLPAWVANSAAIGTVLGRRGALGVAGDLCQRDGGNLQTDVRWLVPGFSDGTTLASKSDADLQNLNGDRLIFAYTVPGGTPGVYLTRGNTLAPLTSDFAFDHNVITLQKSSRQVRTSLDALVGGKFRLVGGQMSAEDVTKINKEARAALFEMVRAEEISEYDVFIDPTKATVDGFDIEYYIVPIGTAARINAKIGYRNALPA